MADSPGHFVVFTDPSEPPDVSDVELEFTPVPRKRVPAITLWRMVVKKVLTYHGVWKDYCAFRKKMKATYPLLPYMSGLVADGIFLERLRHSGFDVDKVASEVREKVSAGKRDEIMREVSKNKSVDESVRMEWVFQNMPGLDQAIDWTRIRTKDVPDAGSVRMLEWAAENRDRFYTAFHAPRTKKASDRKDEVKDEIVAETTARLDELMGVL